ncbi:MAG: hypothetical protein U0172_11035 [Nitrospiraceae bacterium]
MTSSHEPPPHSTPQAPRPQPARGSTFPFGWFTRLDTVVKLALGVFVGSFMLIWGGMYLSRPDRTIPPYSIGSQEGTLVAMHVPPWTKDEEMTALLQRFRKVAHEDRNFGRMKIHPTTPDHPGRRYDRITLYIFTHDTWAEPQMLHRYIAAANSTVREEVDFRKSFENAMRGYYELNGDDEEARIGPLRTGAARAQSDEYSRELFRGKVTDPLPASTGPTPAPSLSPL